MGMICWYHVLFRSGNTNQWRKRQLMKYTLFRKYKVMCSAELFLFSNCYILYWVFIKLYIYIYISSCWVKEKRRLEEKIHFCASMKHDLLPNWKWNLRHLWTDSDVVSSWSWEVILPFLPGLARQYHMHYRFPSPSCPGYWFGPLRFWSSSQLAVGRFIIIFFKINISFWKSNLSLFNLFIFPSVEKHN